MIFHQNRGIRVDADVRLERLEGTRCIQTITVSSKNDGTLVLASTGTLPSASWKQLRVLRQRLLAFAEVAGQELLVTTEGRVIVHVRQQGNRGPKMSIRWWTVARQMLFGID